MTQPLSYGMDGKQAYSLYYKHSNRVPLPGLLLGGLAGIVVGLLAATVYAYSISYIPLIYVRCACALGFGYVLGIVPARLMRWGKVRSVPVVLAMVLAVAAVSYVFHWVVWLYALLSRGPDPVNFAGLLNPATIAKLIGAVYDTGTWTLGHGSSSSTTTNEMISGPFLGLIWLAELAAIFWFAISFAKKSQAEAPYCETCDAWCPAGKQVRSVAVSDKDQLKQQMEVRNWGYLTQVGAAAPGAVQWHAIFHHGCPTCGQLNTLTVKSFTTTRDKKGKLRTKDKIFVDKLLATPEDVIAVRGTSGDGTNPAVAQPPPIA